MEQFISAIMEFLFFTMVLFYYPFRQWLQKTKTADILYYKKSYKCCGYSEKITETIIHYRRIIAMCFTTSCYIFIMLCLKYINHLTVIFITSFFVFILDYITTLCLTKNKIENEIHSRNG